MLEFNVTNQSIKRVDKFNPATDSVDYLKAKFNFLTDDWDGKMLRALFRSKEVSYEAAINADGVCDIPWEVLVSPDNKFSPFANGCVKIFVSVVGTSGTVTLPTREERVEFSISGLADTLNGEAPTPNVFQQYIDTILADNDTTVSEIKADNEATKEAIEADNLATLENVTEQAEIATAKAAEAKASSESLKNDYSNALKGSASGEVVRVDDVSPVEHTAKVKVSGENIDPSSVTVTACGKNFIQSEKITNEQWKNAPNYDINGVMWIVSDDRELTIQGETPTDNYSVFDIATSNRFTSWLIDGATYTVSLNKTGTGNVELVAEIFNKESGKVEAYIRDGTTFTVDKANYTYGTLRLQITPSNKVSCTVMPQIEVGSSATGFEPYKSEVYTLSTNGTCDVVSVSPTMTLYTDTEGANIECEYNKDINVVIRDILAKVNGVSADD